MIESSATLLATLAAQSASALVMAILLAGFHRYYRKSYLLHWMWSWLMLSVSMAASTGASYSAAFGHSTAGLSVSFLTATGAYLHAGLLLSGSWELATRRRVKFRMLELLIAALILMGVLTVLAGQALSPAFSDLSVRLFIRNLIAAVLLLIAALGILRKDAPRKIISFGLLRTSLLLYGLERLHYSGISLASLLGRGQAAYATYLGFVDFVLQALIALGMVACLLEDERQAAAQATVEIEHLAYHDALTGLPNRALFIDRLIVAIAQASRYQQCFAVFFLDLDRFKEVNDSLGHSTGDMMLKGVAERIRRCLREGDTVARFGGDEFTLLVHKIDQIEDAAKIAQKIISTLRVPLEIADRELFATTSIGISMYPNDGADAETLVRNADTAMYRAKEQGRDNYQLYAPTMNARALERLALENMLRKALSHGELIVYYQPLVELETKRIDGVEALLRWQHPELGLLLPAHFISVAEISGLIVPIGDWVLRTACRQARLWQKQTGIDLVVSVNLSARQFQQPDLVSCVKAALEESGLPPRSLELEITESSAMQSAENTIHTLREIKKLGARIAMDDFGTGYSSLSYLKRFPIDTLKLDQSFVRELSTDPEDAAIAAAIISMAHTLALTVVAEGVETEEQLSFLREQGCDRIQGYLFSAPLSATELTRFLVDQKSLTPSTRR